LLQFLNGDVYEGEWENGKMNGIGTFTYADGKKFGEEFRDGSPWNGQGTVKFSNGDVYEGEWKNGKMDGIGTFTYADGCKYTGKWLDGETYNSDYELKQILVKLKRNSNPSVDVHDGRSQASTSSQENPAKRHKKAS